MRGPSKTPPKYRKHKASGKAVVTIEGKDFYLGPYDTKASKLEYDRLIGEWLSNGRSLPVAVREGTTVTELCAEYWCFAKGYYVKSGTTTDELPGLKVALRHTNDLYGKTEAKDFGSLALVAIQNRFIAEGHCRRYVNQNVGRIKRMFKWATARELVPVTTYQSIAMAMRWQNAEPNWPIVMAPQTANYYSGPLADMEDAVNEGRVRHTGNPCLDWMFRYYLVKAYGNQRKPIKDGSKPGKKIDGVQATIMAIDALRLSGTVERCVYNDDDYEIRLV